MKALTLLIQKNYNGTYSIAEPVDREYWGVDYRDICEGDTLEEAVRLAREQFPNYHLNFQSL